MGDTLIRLRVTIEPHIYNIHGPAERSGEYTELQVRVERWGSKEVNYVERVDRDHFHSLFDRIWERAKSELDTAMEEERVGES